MKATGIIRRMDDLGRVVIPKEIRRNLNLREGDPLELYVDNQGGIIFRKYNAMGDYDINLVQEVCQEGLEYTAFGIYDRDGEQVVDLGPVPDSIDPDGFDTNLHPISWDGDLIGYLYSTHSNAKCIASVLGRLFNN
jgi:AbrB family looped-hinge helix DNA binding protein